ncbi:MAG TPA: PIN domain-containing protein [Phycisphaerae bacterium]|jgi:predicted nucleic acid-binding protein
MRYVIDSTIWIKLLRKERAVCERFERAAFEDDELVVTPVAYLEVLRGLYKRDDHESIAFIHELWNELRYEEADRRIWDEAVRLWVIAVRRNELREDADTIIAAFASVLNARLVTANESHFSIFGIPTENWAA